MKKTHAIVSVWSIAVVAVLVSIASGCGNKETASSNAAAASSPGAAATPAGGTTAARPPMAPEGQRYQELMKQNPSVKPNAR